MPPSAATSNNAVSNGRIRAMLRLGWFDLRGARNMPKTLPACAPSAPLHASSVVVASASITAAAMRMPPCVCITLTA